MQADPSGEEPSPAGMRVLLRLRPGFDALRAAVQAHACQSLSTPLPTGFGALVAAEAVPHLEAALHASGGFLQHSIAPDGALVAHVEVPPRTGLLLCKLGPRYDMGLHTSAVGPRARAYTVALQRAGHLRPAALQLSRALWRTSFATDLFLHASDAYCWVCIPLRPVLQNAVERWHRVGLPASAEGVEAPLTATLPADVDADIPEDEVLHGYERQAALARGRPRPPAAHVEVCRGEGGHCRLEWASFQAADVAELHWELGNVLLVKPAVELLAEALALPPGGWAWVGEGVYGGALLSAWASGGSLVPDSLPDRPWVRRAAAAEPALPNCVGWEARLGEYRAWAECPAAQARG